MTHVETDEELEQRQIEAKKQIEDVYNDGVATINGHDYTFTTMTFMERRRVLAYFTSIQKDAQNGNLGFLDDANFKALERDIINKRITIDDMSLGKTKPFIFEEYPEDYLPFIMIALPVICYPFQKSGLGT